MSHPMQFKFCQQHEYLRCLDCLQLNYVVKPSQTNIMLFEKLTYLKEVTQRTIKANFETRQRLMDELASVVLSYKAKLRVI